MKNSLRESLETRLRNVREEVQKAKCLKETGGWEKRAGEEVHCIKGGYWEEKRNAKNKMVGWRL